jgi:hypothetical protein
MITAEENYGGWPIQARFWLEWERSTAVREFGAKEILVQIAPQREPQGSTHFIHPSGTKLGHASS